MENPTGQSFLKSIFDDLINVNKWVFFLLLCLLTATLLFLKKSFVVSQITAFIILESKGAMGMFDILDTLEYLSIPIFYLWKFTITAFVLWVGSFMFGYKINFRNMWHIVMVAEIIFLVPDFLKTVWFILVETDPNYWDIKAFYPLSLMHFFDHEIVAKKWHYPLMSLNLFELLYWLILVYFIHFTVRKALKTSYFIVASSYILFFMLWLVFFVLAYK